MECISPSHPRFRTLRWSLRRIRLTAQDCDVLFGTYPGGTHIEPHTHPTDNWGVITKGEMVIAMEGTETRYAPGDWYHVPALVEHSAYCDVDTEEVEFWFRVSDRK